jgi:two-component system, cell cycle sensor histidine kinase and response regulator CckA
MATESILIVEDERIVARDLQAILQQLGYIVPALAATGADAIAKAKALHPDLVLMDIRLQGAMDGIEAATAILTELAIPVIYLTAFTDDATRQRARQTAPYGYLVKPFDERTVQTTIEMALERHARDRQTRTHEQWLMATLASLGDAVVTTDADGRITFVNPAAEQLLRCAQAEAIGAAVADVVILLDPYTRAWIEHPVMVALGHHAPVHLMAETILVACDGTENAIAGSVVPIKTAERGIQGALFVFQERAEQQAKTAHRAQERQAQEDQQIQRLRVLSSGIAHNFNNLLTVVLGNAELARFDIPEEHPAYASLAQIAPVVERAADLTSQLRAYAGTALMLLEPLDLNKLVRQTVASMSKSMLRSIAIHLQLAPDLPSIKADTTQMHRVVQHMLSNAAEAIGEAVGTITIITELRQLASADFADAVVGADLPPGGYVAVQIADTGCGMDEAMLPRIFDPFFTTKFTGRGLGLSAVLGIVRQHSGALLVQSTPGQGTIFTVFLASAPVQQATASTASRRPE